MTSELLIEELMDEMHAAILVADFQALSLLTPELETALTALEQEPRGDWALLERLRQKANRNANCVQAAGRGVRAALRRLEDVKQNAMRLMTYDESGRRPERSGPSELSQRF